MSGSESSKRASFWLKILLGGAAALAGFLYLGYVDKGVTLRENPEASGQANEQTAAPVANAVPAEDNVAAGEPMTSEVAEQASGEQLTVDESAQLVAGTHEASSAEEPPTGEPEPQDAPALESATSIAEIPSPVPAEVPAEVSAEVTPAEAKAFAEAVISEGETQPGASGGNTDAPAVIDPAAAAPETTVAPAAPFDAPVQSGVAGLAAPRALSPPPRWPPTAALPPRRSAQETLDARRARLISEYEATRRRAEEEMRRRWGQGGMPVPYGYPGYAPGYYPRP
jgi:hypothetical protein